MRFLSVSDSNHEAAAEAIENMADAVTHARFVGTDPASDEVVLMKILQVGHVLYFQLQSCGETFELEKSIFVSCPTQVNPVCPEK